MSRIKPVFKCQDIYKDNFANSQCLLTISVGQEVHEGEKFEATIDLVNKSFNSCIMCVDDSLQRHSMALTSGQDAESFYSASIIAGDEWLKRNERYYSKLTILSKIIRWDTWLKHRDYLFQQNLIKSLIETDINYQQAFDETINEFLRRFYSRLNEYDKQLFNMEKARALCFDYLLEECTAMCLWPETECHFEVYPSPRNLAMHETHRRFVLTKHPHLLHAVAIKFKNRKQLKPQKFDFLSSENETLIAVATG